MFNIPKEIQKILKQYNITVVRTELTNSGYAYKSDVIYLGNHPEKELLPILLHEIGHVIDVKKRGLERVLLGRTLYNAGSENFEVCQAVYETEVIAWNEAKELIKSIGIKINMSIFNAIMVNSLRTYEWSGFERRVA